MTVTMLPGRRWRNWGRSVQAEPAFVAHASTVEEVVAAVRFARKRGLRLRPVGAGHSFSSVAATDGVLLDLSGLDGLLTVNGDRVTLGAGTNLYQIPALLAPHGLAMQNLGDIDRQTIAGAISTGTHGTGARFGGIATQVRGAVLVTADGELLRVSETENAELLPAVALSLGALGVLVEVTLQCVPAFVLQAVERPEPTELVLAEWTERIARADHFEFYVWPHTETVLTKTNTRLPAEAVRHPLPRLGRWFDDDFMANGVYRVTLNAGRAAPALIPPLNRLSVRLTGNRDFTDASATVFTTKRTVRFREQEYAIPVEAIPDAVRAIRALIADRGWRISFPIEVRAAAPDELWLSTAHGRPTGYIAVHRYHREPDQGYFGAVEQVLREFGGRPHWGKMHTRTLADLRLDYPHLDDFRALRDRLDPHRLFGSDHLARILGD